MRRPVATLLAIATLGCQAFSPWPEFQDAVERQIRTDEVELNRIAEAMRDDDLNFLALSDTFDFQFSSPPRLESEDRARYKDLFDRVGAPLESVEIEGLSTTFRFASGETSPHYARWELRLNSNESPSPTCKRQFRKLACGFCSIESSQNREVSYVWVGEEVGAAVVDLEEISHSGEHERLYREELVSCYENFRDTVGMSRKARRITSNRAVN